jgi:hypothetical protein
MIHIIYTYKSKVYQANKNWTIDYAEKVLERLGASYWEIGISGDEFKSILTWA